MDGEVERAAGFFGGEEGGEDCGCGVFDCEVRGRRERGRKGKFFVGIGHGRLGEWGIALEVTVFLLLVGE